MNFSLDNITPSMPQQMTVQEALRNYCHTYQNKMIVLSIIICLLAFVIGYFRIDLNRYRYGHFIYFGFEMLVICYTLVQIMIVLLP